MDFREFYPTIRFLLKFIGLFTAGSLLYALYIQLALPGVDAVTHQVATQTSALLNLLGWPTSVVDSAVQPTSNIIYENQGVLSIYEGCNGLNVCVVFLSFIFSFGPVKRQTFYFGMAGILIIHATNLLRITLLFFVSHLMADYFYFVHKYLFTSLIYLATFVLWFFWVRYQIRKR